MTAPVLPTDRREQLACLILLGAFLGLRAVGAGTLTFDLLDPEELLNLRLARQLEAGLPLGALGQYWYTGVGGNLGIGVLVLSLLYVPLGIVVELDGGALRIMGGLWAGAGAVLMAGLGREILGRGGAAAGLAAAVAMPPTWLAWSLMAYGNYMEAVVLTLLSAWLLLRTARAGPGRSQAVLAAALGLTAVFGGWFCVSAVPASVLLLAAALWVLRRSSPRTLLALAGGVLLGFLPILLGLGPTEDPGSPVSQGELLGSLGSALSSPADWPAILFGSLSTMPVLDYRDTIGEDWAAGWQLASRGLLVGASFALLAACGVLTLGPSRWRRKLSPLPAPPGARAVAWVGAILGFTLPVAMTCLGVGHESLPGGEDLYFWDARRAALVYPILGLAWAALGWILWQLPAPWTLPIRFFVSALLLLALASQGILVYSAEPAPSSFHPVRYLLCPSEQPVLETEVCVTALWEDQVQVLEALVLVPELAQDVEARRLALVGFGSLERDEGRCRLTPAAGGEGVDQGWLWFGLGAAAHTGCPGGAAATCREAPSPWDLRCSEGATWAQGIESGTARP